MVKTPSLTDVGLGSIPGWGIKIPQAAYCAPPSRKKKKNPQSIRQNDCIKRSDHKDHHGQVIREMTSGEDNFSV